MVWNRGLNGGVGAYELIASVAGMNMRTPFAEDQIKHALARQGGDPPFLDVLENIVKRTRRALGGVRGRGNRERAREDPPTKTCEPYRH